MVLFRKADHAICRRIFDHLNVTDRPRPLPEEGKEAAFVYAPQEPQRRGQQCAQHDIKTSRAAIELKMLVLTC